MGTSTSRWYRAAGRPEGRYAPTGTPVNARERLRRYLEQRRELGETEFVLDGMPVEDVLSLVGAPTAVGRPVDRPMASDSGRPSRGPAPIESPPSVDPAGPPPAPPVSRIAEGTSTDWRSTLKAAAARPPAPEPLVPIGAAPLDGTAAIDRLPTLAAVAEAIVTCSRCGLCRTATNAVPGEGGAQAELLCIGEAPGADEDREGRPFVGAAGEVLRKGLTGLKLTPDEYFIANVLKHRPPGNRDPEPAEVEACAPFLRRQVELIRPRVILALGRFAAQTLLQSSAGIGALRGRVHRYQGIPLIVTYHPAATLRNDEWKRPLWEDMKLARRLLDEARAGGSPGLA